MNAEYIGGRQILSKGMENTVLRSTTRNPDIVLKIPRPLNYLSMLGRNQAEILRKELADAQALLDGTTVRIPRTIIMTGKERKILGLKTQTYVVGQKYINEDKSVPNIADHLAQEGLSSLVDEYKHEPRNFISNNGIVYWIDPAKGTAGRLLEDSKMMKLETYRNIRRRLSKVIRFIGM